MMMMMSAPENLLLLLGNMFAQCVNENPIQFLDQEFYCWGQDQALNLKRSQQRIQDLASPPILSILLLCICVGLKFFSSNSQMSELFLLQRKQVELVANNKKFFLRLLQLSNSLLSLAKSNKLLQLSIGNPFLYSFNWEIWKFSNEPPKRLDTSWLA